MLYLGVLNEEGGMLQSIDIVAPFENQRTYEIYRRTGEAKKLIEHYLKDDEQSDLSSLKLAIIDVTDSRFRVSRTLSIDNYDATEEAPAAVEERES